jgi:hypothetical protein
MLPATMGKSSTFRSQSSEEEPLKVARAIKHFVLREEEAFSRPNHFVLVNSPRNGIALPSGITKVNSAI